jgi:hypothetical protein
MVGVQADPATPAATKAIFSGRTPVFINDHKKKAKFACGNQFEQKQINVFKREI